MVALQLTEPGYAFPLQLWPRAARGGAADQGNPRAAHLQRSQPAFWRRSRRRHQRLQHYLDVLNRETQHTEPPVENARPGVVVATDPTSLTDELNAFDLS